MKVGIIDYGAGNLLSVKNALDFLGYASSYVRNPNQLQSFDKVILPGVGSFGYCMQNIRDQNMEDAIGEYIDSNKPFFGICIGLQLLFEESEESSGISGLSILEGTVERFKHGKIPQIGWNKIHPKRKGLFNEGYTYFVNSYYVKPKDPDIIATTSNYHVEFTSAIQHQNIVATQFHPEKSGKFGLNLLRRWLEC